MSEDPARVAVACAEKMWPDDVAAQSLGVALIRVGPGEAELAMPVRSDMANGHGMCHGGFVFTLADSAFAYACNSRNQRMVAQQAAVTFIAPAHVGDTLTARAREVHLKGRGGIYDVTVTNQAGAVIAEFRGHCRSIPGALL